MPDWPVRAQVLVAIAVLAAALATIAAADPDVGATVAALRNLWRERRRRR